MTDAPPESLEGKQLREWNLVKEVGSGAMGSIYRATHAINHGEFAIKCLLMDKETQPGLQDRFLREAKVAAALKHPCIVETFPAFEHEQRVFIPMEFLRGNSITALLKAAEAPFPVDAVTCWMHQAASGLGHAHRKGIFHRDVKPGNLFVLEDGRTLKLLDFGLARSLKESRLTDTGLTVGTPMYLAPEVIGGFDADWRSDIYALGIVMFRLLTLRLPFKVPKVKNAFAIAQGIRKQLLERVPRVSELRDDVPADLDDLVSQMLAVDPDQRIDDAQAVADRLPNKLPAPPPLAQTIHVFD